MDKFLAEKVRRFIEILETTDESEAGTTFYPVQISSVRVLLSHEIRELIKEMKKLAHDPYFTEIKHAS